MQIINLETSINEIVSDLKIPKEHVSAYYKNYYINRTSPIRNLTEKEKLYAKYMSELKYYTEVDLSSMCVQYGILYEDFKEERSLLPMMIVNMTTDEYYLVKRYHTLLIEPYLNYGNSEAPRLTPLTLEEIAMMLTNIAVGKSILPGDTINARVSMEAMDRLIRLHEMIPKDIGEQDEISKRIKTLNPSQLQQMISLVSGKIEVEDLIDVPKELKTSKKKTVSEKAAKKITERGDSKNATTKKTKVSKTTVGTKSNNKDKE